MPKKGVSSKEIAFANWPRDTAASAGHSAGLPCPCSFAWGIEMPGAPGSDHLGCPVHSRKELRQGTLSDSVFEYPPDEGPGKRACWLSFSVPRISCAATKRKGDKPGALVH